MEIFKYILTIYAWGVIGVLIVFLGRIAYFYERTSGQQTKYYFLILPAVLLATGVVWYVMHRNVEFTNQPAGDLLLCGGGILLYVFGARLQEFMTGERR